MSWNYTEVDQREQIAQLKTQLSVNETKLAALQDQLLKQSQELNATKDALVETSDKLRKESDLTVELQETLDRRTEEAQRERLARENTENALHAVHVELKDKDASAKESEHFLSQMAHSATVSQAEHTKLLNDKARLEEQVKSLVAEVRRLQTVPTSTSSKSTSRPRSSSLTNLKLATLEHDLEQVRDTASSTQTELDSTRIKLVQVRNELLRVENEKLVLEKRMQDNNRLLQDTIDEKDDLKREMEYLREHNASEERENDLLCRLDEEEKKVALLEKELSKLSRTKDLKRDLRNTQKQLEEEIGRRLSLEQREVEQAREREIALNNLHEVKGRVRELEEKLFSRDIRIQDLEKLESKLIESLDSVVAPAEKASSVAPEVEKSVETMLAAISRLRAERDQLLLDFDYLQMESRFKAEALQNQVTEMQRESQQNVEEMSMRYSELDELRSELSNETLQKQKLQNALSALSLVIQHLHRKSDDIHAEANKVFDLHIKGSSRLQARITELESRLIAKEEGASTSTLIIADLEEQLGSKVLELTQLSQATDAELASKNEEIEQLSIRLSSNARLIEDKEGEKALLEKEIHQLNLELNLAKEELEALHTSYSRLKATSSDANTSGGVAKVLQDEIKQLESRILRRNEQIGIHQHEIRRLETNLRLQEERVEELEADLEMASMETKAMLEDCATTRGERDEAKRALETAEIEVDKLAASASLMNEEIDLLQQKLMVSDLGREQLDYSHVQELATMVAVVAEKDTKIRFLVASLRSANVDVQQARAHAASLSSELDSVTSSVSKASQDLRTQNEREIRVIADELEDRRDEVKNLAFELELMKAKEGDVSGTLHIQLERAKDQLAALESDKNDLLMRLTILEAETSCALEESSTLRSVLEEERSQHAAIVKDLEEKATSVQDIKDVEIAELKKSNDDVQGQLHQANNTLQGIEKELADTKASYERLESDRKVVSSDQTREITELQDQVGLLMKELERLNLALQDETEGRHKDQEAHLIALRSEVNKREIAAAQDAQLRQELETYRVQLAEVQSNLDELERVKESMQAEMDELSAECHRSKLQSDCLEKEITSNRKELDALQDELGKTQQSLSQSEKACRAAEMKLVLATQQHEQATSSVNLRLKAHEKNDETIRELQRVIADLKEQMAEMDDLLRAKSREIEAEDDKFIELLEEKKKLARKVESLTRKNQNLRKKLEAASESPSPVGQSNSTPPTTSANVLVQTSTPILPIKDVIPTKGTPSKLSRCTLPSDNDAKPPVSNVPSVFTNDRHLLAKSPNDREESLATTSTIGKKRPLPEDSEPRSVPVAAIICEDPRHVSTPPLPSASSLSSLHKLDSSTPRTRRPLQTLRSGFTPNRGQGSTLRPTLSQPSPTRKTAAQALHIAAAITDISSSPAAKRVFSSAHVPAPKPQSRGWLGKIRSGNALVRSRQQPSSEEFI